MPADVPGSGSLEVGWRLARAAWGHGYATEAAHAALRVAFETLDLDDVWSLTAKINLPSRAVMSRLGLLHDATQDHNRSCRRAIGSTRTCFTGSPAPTGATRLAR